MPKNTWSRGLMFFFWASLFVIICLPQKTLTSGTSSKYETLPAGIVVRGDFGSLRVEVCNPGVIRVTASPGDAAPEPESLVVVSPCNYEEFIVEEKTGEITLATESLKTKIDTGTGKVRFLNQDGGLILAEDSDPRNFEPVEIVSDHGYAMDFSFASSPGESYYGLGQREYDRMRLNNRSLDLVQRNTKIAIPFFVSNRGYGVMVDNYSRMNFEFDDNSIRIKCALGDNVDYYFMYGPSLDKVVSAYRDLTGPAPMFPRWAFGLFQSKAIYSTSAKMERVINEYRCKGYPVDVIVQDFFSSAPLYRWGSHNFDPLRWPDPEGFVARLHEQNAKVMVSVWPNFEWGSNNYRDMKNSGYLFDQEKFGGNYYDPYNPGARELYWEQIRDQILVHGYDALWLDSTEPPGLSEEIQTFLGSSARYHNTYSLMTTRGIYEGWRRDVPDKRLFILTRSAFSGQQRYAAASWSGDIQNDFDTLRGQIPAGLNFCLSGVPYWTTDIGGFWGPEMTKAEVFVRWFQYGAFCPIFRVHGVRANNELWSYGEEAEQILVDYDRFRYRLLPYIYSLSWQVTSRGYTLKRALVMDFPDDSEAVDLEDQFMFGPAFLVCPVTKEGAVSRNVYLPSDADWYDFYTGERIKGGQAIEADAPLSQMPLFVRAGAIVPLGPEVQHTGQLPGDTIELRIYPGADADFTLYDDDGLSYAYERGEYSEIPIHWDDAKQTLRIGDRKGTFPQMKEKMTFNIVCVNPGRGIGHGAEANPERALIYEGQATEVSLECAQ